MVGISGDIYIYMYEYVFVCVDDDDNYDDYNTHL